MTKEVRERVSTEDFEFKKITPAFQRYALVSVVRHPYVFSIVQSQLDSDFFKEGVFSVIIQGLLQYFNKYKNVPVIADDLKLYCGEFLESEVGIDRNDVDLEIDKIFASPIPNEDYAFDVVAKFIRYAKINKLLKDNITKLGSSDLKDHEALAKEIALCVNESSFTKSKIFKLSDTEALADYYDSVINKGIIPSSIGALNSSSMYRGYVKGTLGLIVAAPGVGKTSFLINEGAYAVASSANMHILHVFLGDMVEYDGWIRYVSNLGLKYFPERADEFIQNEIARHELPQQQALADEINLKSENNVLDRVHLLTYGGYEKSVEQVIADIERSQEEYKIKDGYDMIMIDYADNFIKESETSYDSHAIIYARLALFARVNNSFVFVASQPRRDFFSEEILPLEAAGESIKKQAFSDLIIGMGMVCKGAKVGTLNVNKVRRGTTGAKIRIKTDYEHCMVEEIDEHKYSELYQEYPDAVPKFDPKKSKGRYARY